MDPNFHSPCVENVAFWSKTETLLDMYRFFESEGVTRRSWQFSSGLKQLTEMLLPSLPAPWTDLGRNNTLPRSLIRCTTSSPILSVPAFLFSISTRGCQNSAPSSTTFCLSKNFKNIAKHRHIQSYSMFSMCFNQIFTTFSCCGPPNNTALAMAIQDTSYSTPCRPQVLRSCAVICWPLTWKSTPEHLPAKGPMAWRKTHGKRPGPERPERIQKRESLQSF